jgi:hypothetical protein
MTHGSAIYREILRVMQDPLGPHVYCVPVLYGTSLGAASIGYAELPTCTQTECAGTHMLQTIYCTLNSSDV